MIVHATDVIRDAAGQGESHCLVIVGDSEWNEGEDNIEHTVNKQLGSILITWLEDEGFPEVENATVSSVMRNDCGSHDIVQVRVGW
jgi:hypothetical protein